MAATDPRVDAYIEKQADFARPILAALRARVHAALPEVEEAIKWGMPFFLHAGKPVANMAAFKAHAAFGFWRNGAAGGEAMGDYGRLTGVDQLPALDEIAAGLTAAIARRTAPASAPRPTMPEATVPPALAEALAVDEAARATFDGFPPSCRREYCTWIGEAKRPETVAKRVAQTIAQLRDGKRHQWQHRG